MPEINQAKPWIHAIRNNYVFPSSSVNTVSTTLRPSSSCPCFAFFSRILTFRPVLFFSWGNAHACYAFYSCKNEFKMVLTGRKIKYTRVTFLVAATTSKKGAFKQEQQEHAQQQGYHLPG